MRTLLDGCVVLVFATTCGGSSSPVLPPARAPANGSAAAAQDAGLAAIADAPVPPVPPDAAPDAVTPDAMEQTESAGPSSIRVTERRLDTCPATAMSKRPVVDMRTPCPALNAHILGDEQAPTGSDKYVALRSAAAFRSHLHCTPPDGFDWTRDQIVALALLGETSTPMRVEGMTGKVVRIGREHLCQGTRSVPLSEVVLIAVPASMRALDVEYCDLQAPPCGRVP